MKIDLDELERKARAAMPITWHADEASVLDDELGKYVVHAIGRHPTEANAQHIAANSPPVTLALVEYIHELQTCALAAAEIAETIAGSRGLGVHGANIAEIRATVEKGVTVDG